MIVALPGISLFKSESDLFHCTTVSVSFYRGHGDLRASVTVGSLNDCQCISVRVVIFISTLCRERYQDDASQISSLQTNAQLTDEYARN